MEYFDDFNPFLTRSDGSTDEVPPIVSTPSTPSDTNDPPVSMEQTYTENILRLNIGKLGTFYFTYSGSTEWRDQTYKGVLEEVGRDHFVIHDPKNDKRYLLQLVYFLWAEFDEAITNQM